METLLIGLYIQGGGLVLGDLESEDILCRTFAERSRAILISITSPLNMNTRPS